MKNFLSIFILSLFTLSAFSQKTLDKGTILMEITDIKSEDPQMAMMLEAMKGSQTEIVFDDQKYTTNMSMMGGMVEMKSTVDKAKNEMNLLFQMMGQKMWVPSTLDDAQSPKDKLIAEKSKVTYDKSQTKIINGYNCYQMEITNPEMGDIKIKGYISEDIKTKANIIQGFQTLEFAGFPMEYTMDNGQFSITMSTMKVTDTVDPTKFNLDTKGYQKLTMEEFQSKMKAMGASGMGF